jgi:hypothetical protein
MLVSNNPWLGTESAVRPLTCIAQCSLRNEISEIYCRVYSTFGVAAWDHINLKLEQQLTLFHNPDVILSMYESLSKAVSSPSHTNSKYLHARLGHTVELELLRPSPTASSSASGLSSASISISGGSYTLFWLRLNPTRRKHKPPSWRAISKSPYRYRDSLRTAVYNR